MNNIKFSVVIPLYNKEKFIKRTLKSLQNQIYTDFEVIIVNDGSTDTSLSVVESVKDKRFKIVEQKNKGVSAARNKGIQEAKNNYIALLDADDEWQETYLKEFAEAINRNPSYICYVANYIKNTDKGTGYNPSLRYVPEVSGELENYFKSCFWGDQVITASSICLNKNLLNANKLETLFPLGVKRGEDLDTWTRLNLNHNFYFINKALVKIHYDNVSASNKPFHYNEAFKYHKWFQYTTDSFEKSFYLYLYATSRILRVFAKTIRLSQLKRRLLGQ